MQYPKVFLSETLGTRSNWELYKEKQADKTKAAALVIEVIVVKKKKKMVYLPFNNSHNTNVEQSNITA